MCGRFIQILNPEKIKIMLPDIEVDKAAAGDFHPHYNIAPTQDILTVINTPVPRLTLARWGLIPFWAKDASIGNRMINARAETLTTKPSFRDPFRKRRCIIFTDGFYEWKSEERSKTPFLIRMKNGEPFAFAGLWDRWTDKENGRELLSSTIITTDANALVADIHNRMPVILPPEAYGFWLSAAPAESDLTGYLKPFPGEGMEAYKISKLVNSPGNDSPEIMDRV